MQEAMTTVLVYAGGQGSGVVLRDSDQGSLVLTCAHVVKNEKFIIVSPHKAADRMANVIKIDEKDDLALLAVDGKIGTGSAGIARRAPPQFETLTVVGAPNTVRVAVFKTLLVSYWRPFKERPHWILDGGTFYGGISGGPVFDGSRSIVGIVSNVENNTADDVVIQGIGICIPLDTIRRFLDNSPAGGLL